MNRSTKAAIVQLEHTFPSCISMCLFLLQDLLNLAPHISQTKGRSPERRKKRFNFILLKLYNVHTD